MMKSYKRDMGLNQEIERIAEKMKENVVQELKSVFKKLDSSKPKTSQKKTKSDENQQYAIEKPRKALKEKEQQNTSSLMPFFSNSHSDWLEESNKFFNQISPFQDMWDMEDPFNSSLLPLKSLNKMEKTFERSLEDWKEELEQGITEDSSCFLKIKTNDNGHVRVKTIKKLPKSDWEACEEEYNVGKPSLGMKKKKLRTLKSRAEKKQKALPPSDAVEIEDETNSPSIMQ